MPISQNCLLALAVALAPVSSFAASPTATSSSPQADSSANTGEKSTIRRSGSWLVEETDNFSICRPVNYQMKPDLAAAIEKLREELCDTWLPKAQKESWNPKCHIVVHARVEGYVKEVGPGAGQTTGSSLIDFDKDSVALRRIDIRGDRDNWFTEALAHELTHIILADRFTHVQIPHWADEGMAIQADPLAKRRLHGRDLRRGRFWRRIPSGRAIDAGPVSSSVSYGDFLWAEHSLVEYLTRIGTKEQLVTFVLEATADGYDAALRKVYKIAGVNVLEHQWRRHLQGLPTERTISRAASPLLPDDHELALANARVEAESMPQAAVLME